MTDQMLIADAHEEIAELKQQLDETIQISPELRGRLIALLDDFRYYESVPQTSIDEVNRILAELGEG